MMNWVTKCAMLTGVRPLHYVEDGLVLHLSGKQNQRNGHSPASTTWEDLSGSGNDFTKVVGGTGAYHNWENDGCYIYNAVNNGADYTRFIGSHGLIATGIKERTMEILVTVHGANGCGNVVLSDYMGAYGCAIIAQGSTGYVAATRGLTGTDYMTPICPEIKGVFTPQLVRICLTMSPLGGRIYGKYGTLTQTEPRILGVNNRYTDIPQIGASGGWRSDMHMNIHSILVYNRALTNTEQIQNLKTHKANFSHLPWG